MGNRLLAIDTTTPACSVALFENDSLIANNYQEIGRGHAEKLIPMIAALPDRGKSARILVNCGPGSFTGVRIGLSAAKALAMSWDAKLDGYQCLALVAAQALTNTPKKETIYVTMTGGHGEFFVQNFSHDGQPLDDLLSLPPKAAIQNAKSEIFVGSGAQQLKDGGNFVSLLPDASKCTLLSKSHLIPDIAPIYGRAPDAQPNQLA